MQEAEKFLKSCKLHKDDKTSRCTDGLCSQCKEEMCQSYFDIHTQLDVDKDHRPVNVFDEAPREEETVKFENCSRHETEFVKFYCPEHDEVGCDDCMAFDHTACKTENILDKANEFKNSEEFKHLQNDIGKINLEAEMMVGYINANRKDVKELNKKFIRDVNMFKDGIISKIMKLTETMLKNGNDIMIADLKKIDNLEEDNKSLLDDITRMRDELQLLEDQSYKLFIKSVECRQQLHLVQDQMETIKEYNTIESFEFKRDSYLGKSVRDCKQLGNIHNIVRDKTVDEAFTPLLKTSESPITPSLQDKQLICTNLKIDGDFLSYDDRGSCNIGLFVTKKHMGMLDCFEIEISSMGKQGSIAIGVIDGIWNDNSHKLLPGLRKNSAGYHSDGTFFNGDKPEKKFGVGPEWHVGDRIQCGIKFSRSRMAMFVHFARNGKWIESWRMRGFCLHSAIGMKSPEDKIKVTIGGKMTT